MQDFKKKYEKLEKLDLGWNYIPNIKILEKVNLKELKELKLINCKISDIGFLEKVKFEKLEKLDLGCNKISNIKILENVKFKELKEINLSYNKISDIKVLEKVKFEKLNGLNLSENKIDITKYSLLIQNLRNKVNYISI